jgi:hypothetical protein
LQTENYRWMRNGEKKHNERQKSAHRQRVQRHYSETLLVRNAFSLKRHYFDYYCQSNVIPYNVITSKTSKILLELALTVRRHLWCLLTVRANFWQSKMRGKQNKLGEGKGVKFGEGERL